MNKILSVLVMMTFLVAPLPAQAQEDFDSAFDELDKAFEQVAEKQEETWDKVDAALEAEWEAQVKQTEAEWEKLRAEVEQKWDEFYYSTNKEWVDYDADKDTRSRVNFEAGEIEVTVLVPVEEIVEPKPVEEKPAPSKPIELKPEQVKQVKTKAEKKIAQQVEKIFSTKNEVKSDVLAGQVEDSEGKAVTPQNVAQYVEKEVVPKVVVDKKPVVGKDGKPRIKVTAKIKLMRVCLSGGYYRLVQPVCSGLAPE